ncbi:unnamed protein product [Malus baccata var. baccata]
MDASNMAHQSESPITPLASTDVGDQIELAYQTTVQEATKLEGNNSTVLISSMDPHIFNAAKQGNLNVLKEQGKNLDKMLTATKNTVLHIYTACCMHPHVPPYRESEDDKHKSRTTVDGILEMCPALLWKQNESGDTALHIAARYGRYGIVEALIQAAKKYYQGDLEQGCENSSEDAPLQWQKLIWKTNNKKDTALHEAVRFQYGGMTFKLTDADPEFSYSTNDAGETPLYLAVERGYSDCCDTILEVCKNPTYGGPNGRTALHVAVMFPDGQGMTRALLKSDRTLAKVADEQGGIPLHIAADLGTLSTVKVLLEYDKSTAYVADNDGRTALHFAASKGHVDIMKELRHHCPDCCELVDNKGQNVLHYAIKSEQDHVVDFVLTDLWFSNILLNAKDRNGNAPVHHLAHSRILAMNFIRDHRVDTMSFNKENLNAYDIIQANDDNISKAFELVCITSNFLLCYYPIFLQLYATTE